MSSEFAIEVTNLGKCYQIYNKPSDRLKQILFPGRRQYYKEFWALKGVTFKVRKGETVGVIGRNGCGKSTLLQLICGTLNPTLGEVKVNGRVAALLELGAGFNPEFTGVENVYMAASLYGLTKEEVKKRFDAIAAFADIGDHINQPVKTYSSGMYVRLAFSVIAHVDADILVIDEALAVGDAIFTQKCMRFIREFQRNGVLIFVSHDIAAVRSLCDLTLWLTDGHSENFGSSKSVTDLYLKYVLQETYGKDVNLNVLNANKDIESDSNSIVNYQSVVVAKNNFASTTGWRTDDVEIVSVKLDCISQEERGFFKGGEKVILSLTAKTRINLKMPILGFLVRDRLGQDLFGENTLSVPNSLSREVLSGQRFIASFEFRLPMLPNGEYSLMASVAEGSLDDNVQHHWMNDALLISVNSSKVRYGLVGLTFDKVEMKILND